MLALTFKETLAVAIVGGLVGGVVSLVGGLMKRQHERAEWFRVRQAEAADLFLQEGIQSMMAYTARALPFEDMSVEEREADMLRRVGDGLKHRNNAGAIGARVGLLFYASPQVPLAANGVIARLAELGRAIERHHEAVRDDAQEGRGRPWGLAAYQAVQESECDWDTAQKEFCRLVAVEISR